MPNGRFRGLAVGLGAAATVVSVALSALAQPPDQPPPGQEPPSQGAYNPPPPQGAYNVPPPPGYQPGDDRDESSDRARQQDQRYSYEAERWAAQNCIAQRANNGAAGAVIGGILGALVGSGLSSRRDSGAGIVAGAGLGAIAGNAIGRSDGSNPNCPPGYALRAGAAPFYPGPVYGGDVVYAAPPDYDPWIWYGGHWIYRPYPYHRYWYRHEFRRDFRR